MSRGVGAGSALRVTGILKRLGEGIVRDVEGNALGRKHAPTSGGNLNTGVRSLEFILLKRVSTLMF